MGVSFGALGWLPRGPANHSPKSEKASKVTIASREWNWAVASLERRGAVGQGRAGQRKEGGGRRGEGNGEEEPNLEDR